jgi:threonine dehydrogenase-like Zn-dependent dehydrogenase
MSAAPMSRAAVFASPRHLSLTARPLPRPGPGEVRVRLAGCGICASNLPVWQGRDWFEYPFPPGAPGHEGWGEIDALGEGVEGFAVGDAVAMLSYHAYAEHDLARADALVRLPPSWNDRPFPGEPLACAMNIWRRSEVRPGQTLAVVGVGFLGALLIQLARHEGVRTIALSHRPFSLEVARAMGADETVSTADPWAAVETVQRLTEGQGCARAIEAAGLQSTLDLASRLMSEGGRLIVAGYHQDGLRQVDMQRWNWLGLDVVNAHERDPARYIDGMAAALAAVQEGRLDPAPLLTHGFRLDELERGFRCLDERPDGFVKGMLLL